MIAVVIFIDNIILLLMYIIDDINSSNCYNDLS